MNSNTQHTPGPWTQEREFTPDGTVAEAHGRGSTQIMSNGYHIGTWIDAEYDGHCPNSALIAAAPGLLAALRGCIHHDDGIKPQFRIPSSLRRQIEVAIAKAEGK